MSADPELERLQALYDEVTAARDHAHELWLAAKRNLDEKNEEQLKAALALRHHRKVLRG